MPKVEIIHFTGALGLSPTIEGAEGQPQTSWETEFAARLLVFTKQTRLQMSGARFAEVLDWPWEKIEAELDYMAGTIPSSWEFCDVTFAIQQVSRACAQQITRTRFTPMDADIFGSYAMQSFRVEELKELTFHVNPEVAAKDESHRIFLETAHEEALENYKHALSRGIPQQDARGLLPMDTHANLVVKFNLRQLVDMLRTRDESLRVQGEYGEVAHQMKLAVLEIWPWSAKFFEPKDAKAIRMIEDISKSLKALGSTMTPNGTAGHPVAEYATTLAKAADLLKK